MGQKINPKSFRVGITQNWTSRWFFPASEVDNGKGKKGRVRYAYARFLEEDELLRTIVKRKLALAGIASIEIERTGNVIRMFIRAARPGLIIGRGGKGTEELTQELEAGLKKLRKAKIVTRLSVNIEELKRSEVAAAYVAQQIAWDLEKRMPYRRAMKKYLEQAMQNRDVKGVKVLLSGRLNGSEIARRETMKQGALPLQTLRANLDFGTATAFTTYGTIGIKVWVYKGEIFQGQKSKISASSADRKDKNEN